MDDADESAVSFFRHESRTLRSSPLSWLLLVGDRVVIATLLTLVFGASFTLLVVTETVAVDTSTSLLYLFQGLVAGNLTLLTIVLSVNQLVLSSELNAPGELQEQIGHAIEFRDGVRETTDQSPMPITPSEFLEALLVGIRESAIDLRGTAAAVDDEGGTEIEGVVSDVITRTDEAIAALKETQTGVFGALAVALEINFSRELRDVREIRASIDGENTPDLDEKSARLTTGLKQVDVARQYFKSLYMQSELARFSRLLLYVGIPAVGCGILLLATYAGIPGPSLERVLSVVVPVVVTVSFAPLALLFAFVLRISIVAQRTVAVTPFTMAPEEKDIVDEGSRG